MLNVEVLPWANLPSVIKDGKTPGANYLLLWEGDTLLDYLSDEKLTEKFNAELLPLIDWISSAYRLGVGDTKDKPSNKLCAYLAFLAANETRKSIVAAKDAHEERKMMEEARAYDAVADRFAKGLQIGEIFNLKQKRAGFTVKGEHGSTYALNSTGTTCTCVAGLSGTKICWHMRAVEVYLEAYKTLNLETQDD